MRLLRPAAAAVLLSVTGGCGGQEARRAAPTEPAPSATAAAVGERGHVIVGPRGGPLVLALHGVGGAAATPEFMAEVSGLGELAEREGFAVVFADGEGDWDDADLPYLRELLDTIPHDRAYAVGWSGGGFMVHRLACELSDRLDAIAVLQAPLSGRCRPDDPVSVLQIVGTADAFIPPEGGTTPDGARTPPVAAAMARWRKLNGCRGARRSARGRVRREVATGCRAGARVELLSIRGGGHEWYGPDAAPPDDAVDASREAWRFFAGV